MTLNIKSGNLIYQKGDSGGGLIEGKTNNTDEAILVGIVSFGTLKCEGPNFLPGIYTSVGAIRGWIQHVV